MAQSQLPKTHRILQLTSTSEPLQVKTVPTPVPGPGSAIVRVLAASTLSYSNEIYNGKRQYPFPAPFVPGCSAIGRIAAIGPDATTLKEGQLVLLEATIRGRDNPSAIMLSGVVEGFDEASAKLMRGEWRDSTYAEYVKFPLENCIPLDEKVLLGLGFVAEMRYQIEDLVAMVRLLVPYGGLDDINLKAGETVIIAPATGQFGSAAVRVALAMGAGKVLAMGRNEEKLEELTWLDERRVLPIEITGDEIADAERLKRYGPADAFFDISSPLAAGSTHFKSAIAALKHSGRISLMGGLPADISFAYADFMQRNLSMKGTWMYTRNQILSFLNLVYSGRLPLGEKGGFKRAERFSLDQWKGAFDRASKAENDEIVVIAPQMRFKN